MYCTVCPYRLRPRVVVLLCTDSLYTVHCVLTTFYGGRLRVDRPRPRPPPLTVGMCTAVVGD